MMSALLRASGMGPSSAVAALVVAWCVLEVAGRGQDTVGTSGSGHGHHRHEHGGHHGPSSDMLVAGCVGGLLIVGTVAYLLHRANQIRVGAGKKDDRFGRQQHDSVFGGNHEPWYGGASGGYGGARFMRRRAGTDGQNAGGLGWLGGEDGGNSDYGVQGDGLEAGGGGAAEPPRLPVYVHKHRRNAVPPPPGSTPIPPARFMDPAMPPAAVPLPPHVPMHHTRAAPRAAGPLHAAANAQYMRRGSGGSELGAAMLPPPPLPGQQQHQQPPPAQHQQHQQHHHHAHQQAPQQHLGVHLPRPRNMHENHRRRGYAHRPQMPPPPQPHAAGGYNAAVQPGGGIAAAPPAPHTPELPRPGAAPAYNHHRAAYHHPHAEVGAGAPHGCVAAGGAAGGWAGAGANAGANAGAGAGAGAGVGGGRAGGAGDERGGVGAGGGRGGVGAGTGAGAGGTVPFPPFLKQQRNGSPLVKRGEPLLGGGQEERVPRTDFEIPYKELTTSDLIGQGAFGRVFKGRWRGTPVAVKMLVCQHLTSDVVKEFRAEVAVLSALRHPNVILFMGACTVSPHLCIVTELAPRGSLWGVLHGRGSKLVWRTVMKMIVDTARGMAFLHSAKPSILHRDLKSGNLLVDDAYSIKLSDFGLARVKAYTATMTGNCGTYQWMAPEVLANARYTEKADVYSFGVVCWELFTSRCPYESMNQIQVAMAVLNEGKRLAIPSSTPTEVADVVRQCWHADPQRRPAFLEILDKLEVLEPQ